MSEWIKCEDRLPPKNAGEILVYVGEQNEGRDKLGAHMRVQTGINYGFRKVTHWMPLPKPPD